MYTAEMALPNGEELGAYKISEYTPSAMNEQEIGSLADELLPLTVEGFMREGITDQLRQDVVHHISGSERVVVARLSGEPNAYVCASFCPTAEGLLYHLEGIMVASNYQGTGLAFCLLARELRIFRPQFLGFHTQSARMAALGSKLASFDAEDAVRYGATIDTRNQAGVIDVGRYGGKCLYGDENRFSGQAIDYIDWRKGDALVFIGRVGDK